MKIEKQYPIYYFSAKWSQDGEQDSKYPKWYEGLPEGRIWNSTGFSKMFKEEKTQEELDNIINEWWEKYKTNKDLKNSILDYLKIEFKEFETWYLTWFQHETFDMGQTDEEALESFENFVNRKVLLNEKSQRENGKDVYCLMGGEDRWRWYGTKNGDSNEHTEAPCRCIHCKEQGVIRIGH